jgi:hypothetical protein
LSIIVCRRYVSGADLDAWYVGGSPQQGGEVVEAIVDHRDLPDGSRQYLAAWEGFSERQKWSWVPSADFGMDSALVVDYERGLLRGPRAAESRVERMASSPVDPVTSELVRIRAHVLARNDADVGEGGSAGPSDKAARFPPGPSAVSKEIPANAAGTTRKPDLQEALRGKAATTAPRGQSKEGGARDSPGAPVATGASESAPTANALIKPSAVEAAADRVMRIIKPRLDLRGNRATDKGAAGTGPKLGRGQRVAKPKNLSDYDVGSEMASARKKKKRD